MRCTWRVFLSIFCVTQPGFALRDGTFSRVLGCALDAREEGNKKNRPLDPRTYPEGAEEAYWTETPPLTVSKLRVGPPEPRLVSMEWRLTPDRLAPGTLREVPPLTVLATRCAE